MATAPVTLKERIISLDVLRGFALLGILVMNIQSFSMPMSLRKSIRSEKTFRFIIRMLRGISIPDHPDLSRRAGLHPRE